MNSKNQKTSHLCKDPAHTKNKGQLLLWFFFTLAVTSLLFIPEAIAVKEGEMKVGVNYLTGLLDNNIIPLVLLAGTGAGAALAYMKSSFSPLLVAICTGAGYGFAHKWISSVYTACI